MDESRIWGSLGVLLAVAGLVVIALDNEFLTALSEGHVGEPIVFYVVGVALAVLVTIVIIAPSMTAGR
jgi:drug/metabolite transporter (DMT)-like permease